MWSVPKLTLFFFYIIINGIQFGHNHNILISNHSLVVILDPRMFQGGNSRLKAVRNMAMDIVNRHLTSNLIINFQYIPDLSNYKDLSAVLSVVSCKDTWNMFNSVKEENILFIALTEPNCPRLPLSTGITLPLTNAETEISQLLLDLRMEKLINWRLVNFIYDTSIRQESVKDIIKIMTQPEFPGQAALFYLYKIEVSSMSDKKTPPVDQILKKIQGSDKHKYMLAFVSSNLISDILGTAKIFKLTNPLSQWLFIVSDWKRDEMILKNISSVIGEGENVAFIINESQHESKCQEDILCYIQELMQTYSMALEKFIEEEVSLSDQVSEEEWETIKPSKQDRLYSMLNFMKIRIKENGKCGNHINWTFQTSDSWGINFLPKGNKVELNNVGYWSPNTGAVLIDHLFPHNKYGFKNRELPIVTFHVMPLKFPPWQIIKYNESGQPSEYKGLVFEIIEELSKQLNFTYSVINLSNSSSSVNNPVKQSTFEKLGQDILDAEAELRAWNKALEIVRQKKVFIAAIAFTRMEERKLFVNFTTPVVTEPYTFLVSRPKELSRALLFLLPFTSNTWICIVGALLIIAPVLNFVHRISPFYEHYKSRKKQGFRNMMNCFWYIYGALLQQGGATLPDADSGRLVIGTWWLVVLVIVTTYSGNLVAFLTFPKMEHKISTLDQLLERKGTLTWGMSATSSLPSLLLKTGSERLHKVAQGAVLHKELTPGIIDHIRNGMHAYLERKSNLMFIMKRDFLVRGSCDFTLGQEEFLEEHLALIMFPGNPYLETINKEIDRMHRTGLIQKWQKEYLPKKDKCWSTDLRFSSGINNHTVNLKDMQGSFFVLIFGIFLGALLAVGEHLYNKWRKSTENKLIRPFVM